MDDITSRLSTVSDVFQSLSADFATRLTNDRETVRSSFIVSCVAKSLTSTQALSDVHDLIRDTRTQSDSVLDRTFTHARTALIRR